MFSAQRKDGIIYILEKKDKPTLKIGKVESVSTPMPKYNTAYGSGEMVVDVTVKVEDETIDFKGLPATQSMASYGNGNTIISESREAMSAEVESMMRTSQCILDSIDYHKTVVVECDTMLRTLNPTVAKERERDEKIGSLEIRMNGMCEKLEDMMSMLSRALGRKQNGKNYENDSD